MNDVHAILIVTAMLISAGTLVYAVIDIYRDLIKIKIQITDEDNAEDDPE